MDDIFMERIVRRKKDGTHYLKIALIIATAFMLATAIGWIVLAIPVMSFLFPIVLVGCGYGAWWMITSQDIEYEYIVTNGEIDIDSIVHRRKRKRLFSGRAKDFEVMARLDSDEFRDAARRVEQERKSGNLKLVNCAAVPGNAASWFFIANYKTGRLLVVFDPDEKMLVNLKRFNPSRVKYNPTIQG